MTTLHKAAQQALEALDEYAPQHGRPDDMMVAITALRAALAQQAEPKGGGNLPPPLQAEPVEPVDFVSLLREADEIVRGKPTWKRFIDGTPLSNDIAVWMTVFAQDVARRAAPSRRKPLTDEEIVRIFETPELAGTHFQTPTIKAIAVARAIERAHGIGEQP